MSNPAPPVSTPGYVGPDVLRLTYDSSLRLPLTLSEPTTLSYAARLPAGAELWITDHGQEMPGSRLSGANADWHTVGPLSVEPGEHELDFVTSPGEQTAEPAFHLAEVRVGDAPVHLQLWAERQPAPRVEQELAANDTGTADLYFTSFEETGILYFLRYIPWLDWSLMDWITYVRQSSERALSGTYSAHFVQVPAFGASTLWSRELDIPSTSTHCTIVFGAYATRADTRIAYRTYIDGVLQADRVGSPPGADHWVRIFIDQDLPLGSRKFRFEISLEPLPDIPVDNAFFMDDLQVDFGRPPDPATRTLCFGDLQGNIYGLDNRSGSKRWMQRESGGYAAGGIASTRDAVYYGLTGSPGVVVARNAENGSRIWSQPLQSAVGTQPVVVDGRVYVAADDGKVYGLDTAAGTIAFSASFLPTGTSGVTPAALVVESGVAYVSSSGGLFALDLSTQAVLWGFPLRDGGKTTAAVWDDYVFFGGADGVFRALRRNDGTPAWTGYAAGAPVYTVPQIVGGLVVFGTDAGELVCLEAMTGRQVWKLTQAGRIRGFRVLADRVYFVAAGIQGTLYAYGFQIDDGGRWTFTPAWTQTVPGGVQQSPVIDDQRMYLTGGDRKTYAYATKTGAQLWSYASEALSFITPSLQEAPAVSDLARRYDQACWLCTHNAFANTADGWIYAEQSYSLTAQLEDGVRALMLDAATTRCRIEHALGPDAQRVCGPDVQAPLQVYMIHEDLTRTSLALLPTGLDALRTFSDGLREIRQWMDNNPNEVVTIILESQVSDATLMTQALQDGGFPPERVFWADRPNPSPNGTWIVADSGWPSLQWMVTAGRRLVILSQHRSGNDGLPAVWDYAVENDFGNAGLAPGCAARRGSRPLNDTSRSLFIMNFFVDWSVSHAIWYPFHYARQNDYFSIIAKVNECASLAGRLPNFLAVDFYQRGDNGGPMAAAAAVDGRWRARTGPAAFTTR